MIKYSGSVSLDNEAMAVLLKLHLNPSITITRLEISQVVGLGLLLGAGLACVDLTRLEG